MLTDIDANITFGLTDFRNISTFLSEEAIFVYGLNLGNNLRLLGSGSSSQ